MEELRRSTVDKITSEIIIELYIVFFVFTVR